MGKFKKVLNLEEGWEWLRKRNFWSWSFEPEPEKSHSYKKGVIKYQKIYLKWNNMSAISWTSMHTLVTGPLHCRNCGKAFSSPKCKLSYRLLPWNPEMENFVGALTGIEPASAAFWAGVLNYTTAPWYQVYQIC